MLLIFLAICTVMADIRLKATGIVMDAQGINIAGVYVKLFQQQAVIGSTQTKEDGSYEFTLSITQQEKQQFSLETSLINNLQTPLITQCTPILKENELIINQDIKLTVDDVTVNGPAVIAKINGQYLSKQQPLSGVTINYEIDYQDKTTGLTKYTFPGASNDLGISKLFIIYPKGPGVLKFSAQKENFWTFHQTKDDEKFTLIVSQEYKVNYVITMEEGQFSQKVLGTIVNKNTVKPLADVKVVVTFSSESKGLLQSLNQVTDSTGKFEISYQTKLWKKFIIHIEFFKEFYAHNEMTKTLYMDHEDRTKISDNWDLGIVKLPVQPQVNLDGYVIDAYKKPVENLKISMVAVSLDIKTNFDVTTDKDGHWEVQKLQLEPSSNYELTMKYKLKSGDEIINQFKFSTTEEPQEKITINPLYYETLIQPEISGQFNLENDMLPLKIPIIISCLKDNSQLPDLMKGITNFQQKFDMKWQATRKFDQILSCSITNENTDITQPFVKNVILKATEWKADEKIIVKYNVFKQIMQGIINDDAKIVKFVGDAKINLKIYQKDTNLHTENVSKELISNGKDGSFYLSFLLAKGEKSQIGVKVTHPDFQDFSKDDFIDFSADKDTTVVKDIQMKRVELNVILNYKVNTLQQPATISLKASEPLMNYESLYSPKTFSSTDGSFKISFTCYQNIDYTVKFELHITSYSSQMYDSNTFKCVIPTKEKPDIEVTSESLFVPGRFTVKFLDVNNKPAQGIEGKFQTKPISQVITSKSGIDGIISIQDINLFKNQDYTGILQYQDTSGHQLSAEIKFYTKNINDIYPFPDQSLAGQVVFTISGKLTLDRGSLINPVQVSVTCDHSISASGATLLDGSFKVQFEKQTNFEDTIKCKASFTGDIEPVSYDVTFTKGKYTDTHDIQTKLKDVLLNINGQFINPLNKPQSDLPVDISLEAAGLTTEKQTLKTNAKGEWNLIGRSLKANLQYIIKLSYKNGAQQDISTSQPYKSSVFTLKPTDDFTYPISYFQDFETCHTFGQIEKPQNMLPVQVPLSYKCDTIEKTHKNILGIVQSTYDFKYDIKFDGLVEFDKPLECEMSSGNEKVAKFNEKLLLSSPKWELQQNFKIQFISWKIHISGDAIDSTGIEKNLKDTKISITIHQKQKQISYLRGLNHFLTQTTDFSTVSANQQYEFKFEILNEETLQTDIKATHADFVDFAQIDALEISGKKDEELKYEIKLQRVSFQAILSGTAEETGSIYIKDTNPKMSNDQYNVKTPVTSGKSFQAKFQCYQNVEYTAKFVIENEHKQSIEYVSDPFKCKKAPELTTVTLKSLNDKIDLDISGKVTDKEKIIDSVEGATIIIEITKEEKVVQKSELKTNNLGIYNQKFTLRKDTYKIKYSITHPQFIDQSQTKDINLSQNSEIKTDFILERVVQTQKIKINLKDGNGKPIQGSSVTASGFSPKPHEKVVVKGEDSGVATVEVSCFKGVDETFQMEVAVQDLKETTKQSVSCTGVSGERSVTLQSQYITISGQIIDPYGKGSDLDLQLTTQPASQQKQIKSLQGNWNSELLVSLDKSYNFVISYNGWDNQQVKEEQTVQIKSGETTINYHIIYYKNLIESIINGKVSSKKYHISLKFHKVLLLKEGIEVANIEIDQFDEYQIKYKFVAAYNQKYDFSLQIKETQKFKQEIVPYTIIPPKYSLNIDITVSETDAYINEIKTHFSKYLLKGYLGSEYNCKDKIHRAVQLAAVSIVKKGQDGDKVKAATHTGDDGKFQMYFFLSKKQVENNIIVWLYIEKEGFISPSPQLIMPSQFERFQIDEETITSIDIGYQSISPIHDMGCPSNLPTLTSDDQIIGKKLKN